MIINDFIIQQRRYSSSPEAHLTNMVWLELKHELVITFLGLYVMQLFIVALTSNLIRMNNYTLRFT